MTAFVLMCPLIGIAQEVAKEVSIINLEIPSSPAFILLDNAPSTIQRPNSSRALGATLLQNIATDGVFDNIAFEVTPFWMSKSPNRSALKFYGVDKEKQQNYFSKIKMASFSAAYVKESNDIINVSMGGRATIFEIKRKEDIDAYFDAYNDIENLLSDIGDILEEFDLEVPIPECTDRNTNDACKKQWEAYNIKQKEFINKRIDENSISAGFDARMQEVIQRKPALAVDFAIGYNHRYYNNEFDNNGFGRLGAWSTLAGSFFLSKKKYNQDYLNLYGFFRYLKEGDNGVISDMANDEFDAFDLGVKAELEFKKITIGYEYINRSGDLEGYRSVGNIKYKAFDNVYLTGTFGNNFEEQDDLVTLFGIQWGFNNPIQSIGVAK